MSGEHPPPRPNSIAGTFSKTGQITCRIIKAADLPVCDLTTSDPYVKLTVGSDTFQTEVVPRSLNPMWFSDHIFNILDTSNPIPVSVSIWDSNTVRSATFCAKPNPDHWEISPSDTHKFGLKEYDLEPKGKLWMELYYHPMSIAPQGAKVKCSVFTHHVVGALRSGNEVFPVYQIQLRDVDRFYNGTTYHWNEKYDAAIKIFNSPTVQNAIYVQHRLLYGGLSGKTETLSSGNDFIEMLKFGVRKQKIRYYTYCITLDGMFNFAETGVSTSKDFTSKHAMHSNCSVNVKYAGEFLIMLVNGIYTMYLDNNSGTYGPPREGLEPTKKLLEDHFPGIHIVTVHWQDELLKTNKALVTEQRAHVNKWADDTSGIIGGGVRKLGSLAGLITK